MGFTNRQKNIIVSIFNKEVFDLASFVEKYYDDVKFFIDSKIVQKKKTEDFRIVRDSVDDIMQEFNELMRKSGKQLSDKIVKKYRKVLLNHQLILADFKRIPLPTGNGYTNFEYINKDLYYIEDYSLFDDFIYVIKYLKSENYIVVEEDKNTNHDMFRFFLHKYDNNEKQKGSLESDYKRMKEESRKSDYTPHYAFLRYGYYQTDADYLDFKIQINRESHQKYGKYFSEVVIVKPELGIFIERGFINTQEYGLKISHRKTNIAIGISIFIGLFSIWTSILISKGNTEFWQENEIIENINHIEIVEILESIEGLSSNQFTIIEQLYMELEDDNSVNIKKLSDEYYEINQGLEELIKVLKDNNTVDGGE